jgi:hypothetical protein
MNTTYLVHVVVKADNDLTDQEIDELFCYLELQLASGTNVRAEVSYHEQI